MAWSPGTLIVILFAGIAFCDGQSYNPEFDQMFKQFLEDEGYRGGAVAAMKEGRLIHAHGYGEDRNGYNVLASSHFPASSLAKSFTAVAIMKLVQRGELFLDDKVFGSFGLLPDLEPLRPNDVPDELFSITVDNLLRHTAGFDDTQEPLEDAVLNEFFLQRGYDVPDIAEELDVLAPAMPEDIIEYVMSQPLAFTPGTDVAYSNVAYLILGRIVEEISGMEYRDYVKRCLFDTRSLLDDHHLALLLARPAAAPVQHDDSWHCAGFRTNTHGVVWQDGDPNTDDLILYHETNPERLENWRADMPDTWVVMLYDRHIRHLRHYTRDLMEYLDASNQDYTKNVFAWDLSELHRHPLWENLPRGTYTPEYTLRYRLDEHHLTAYMVALQDEGFNLEWFTTYTMKGHTYFLVMGKRAFDQIGADFLFQHGLDLRTLRNRKLELEEVGFNMTMLHSYKSMSHADPTSFAAVFRPRYFQRDTQMKYGTSHLPEPYENLVAMYFEKQFFPISQTVVYHNEEEEFSFIYIKENRKKLVVFQEYYDLTAKRLAKIALDNAKDELRLTYLNSYDTKNGRFRLSAVFSNATRAPGVLEVDQPEWTATETTIYNLEMGLLPKFVVPYLNEEKQVRLAMYFQDEGGMMDLDNLKEGGEVDEIFEGKNGFY